MNLESSKSRSFSITQIKRETSQLKLTENDEQPRHTHITSQVQNPKSDPWKKPLDPNHKYFLLIDDQDDGGEAGIDIVLKKTFLLVTIVTCFHLIDR